MFTGTTARDRAAFLLQAIDSELKDGIRQALGEQASAEEQLHEAYLRILTRQESRVTIELVDEIPGAVPALLIILPPEEAVGALAGLPEDRQHEYIREMSRMQPGALLAALGRAAAKLSGRAGALEGIAAAAEVLNLTPREEEKRILRELEETDVELAEQLRRKMFVFEDIILVNDKGIQATLKEVEHDELSLALKTATEELQAKIFKNMSERAARLIKEDMEFMGPVRLSDVEAAQQRIVDIVARLEEAGEVIIQGGGGKEEIVV